jgi:hypothetical protein
VALLRDVRLTAIVVLMGTILPMGDLWKLLLGKVEEIANQDQIPPDVHPDELNVPSEENIPDYTTAAQLFPIIASYGVFQSRIFMGLLLISSSTFLKVFQ